MSGSGDQVPLDIHTEGMAPTGVKPELHWMVRVAPSPLPLTTPSSPFSGESGSLHWTV